MAAKEPQTYTVVSGINWPDGTGGEQRREPGDTVGDADLKGANVPQFLKDGAIVPSDPPAKGT